MDGEQARLRYGGDMSAAALPKANRPDPKVKIVDLFAGPVAFDARGRAKLSVDVPDFNGSLRLAALAWTDSRYGNADGNITVRAPLVVEPSTPRVMAAGDKAVISLDLKNLSGKDGTAKVGVKGNDLIHIDQASQSVGNEGWRWHHAQHAGDRRCGFGRGKRGYPCRTERLRGRSPLRVRGATGMAGNRHHHTTGAGKRQDRAFRWRCAGRPVSGHCACPGQPEHVAALALRVGVARAFSITRTAASSRPPARVMPR